MTEHMSQLQAKYFKVWSGKDILTYGADKAQVEIRKKAMIQMMKESDRYKTIRQSFMVKYSTIYPWLTMDLA